jgi:hypothetical protein
MPTSRSWIFTELMLFIDVSSSSGNITIAILEGCQTKDYEDGNGSLFWEKLKKKFNLVSVPTLVKKERMFMESKVGKNEGPEIWINNLLAYKY